MPKSELETFADIHANEVFSPLYKNDLFYLGQLEKSGNTNAYYELLWELVAKWQVHQLIQEAIKVVETTEEIKVIETPEEQKKD